MTFSLFCGAGSGCSWSWSRWPAGASESGCCHFPPGKDRAQASRCVLLSECRFQEGTGGSQIPVEGSVGQGERKFWNQ